MANNYTIYIDGVKLPINPSTITIKVGNKNETVELASGGDMSILKSPALTEISFTARLPQMGLSGDQLKLPYLNAEAKTASYYIEKLKTLKTSKKVFQFVVTRYLPNGKALFETNLTTVLEHFTTKEDADEGFDILVEITLKQYVKHVTKVYKPNESGNTTQRVEKPTIGKNYYTIKTGDTLWSLAKRHYGDGTQWRTIYDANKLTIETAAQQRGRNSSNYGHWIYPGTRLVIPVKG